MTRAEALIDAAVTVQRWKRRLHPRSTYELRIRRHVGRTLDCGRTWVAIEEEILRRLLIEEAVR